MFTNDSSIDWLSAFCCFIDLLLEWIGSEDGTMAPHYENVASASAPAEDTKTSESNKIMENTDKDVNDVAGSEEAEVTHPDKKGADWV